MVLDCAQQSSATFPIRADAGLIDDAVKGIEEENCREARIVNQPSLVVIAGFKKLSQMIDETVAREPLSRRGRRCDKDEMVQSSRLQIPNSARLRPSRQFAAPILWPLPRDFYNNTVQHSLHEPYAQRFQDIGLRGEMEIERPLGDVSALRDLLDGGVLQTFFQEEAFGRVHEVIAPFLMGLGPWSGSKIGRHRQDWSVTVGDALDRTCAGTPRTRRALLCFRSAAEGGRLRRDDSRCARSHGQAFPRETCVRAPRR